MDLEQFRRAYMHMEGVTNTPGNFVKEVADLLKVLLTFQVPLKETSMSLR